MKPRTYYFIRHAHAGTGSIIPSSLELQRGLNRADERLLSARGRQDAGKLAKVIPLLKVDGLVASVSLRSMETATMAAMSCGLPLLATSELFGEIDLGQLVGHRRLVLAQKLAFNSKVVRTSIGLPCSAPLALLHLGAWARGQTQQGEGRAMLASRIEQALAFLDQQPQSRLAVISHGLFISALCAYLSPAAKLRRYLRLAFARPCAITRIDTDEDGHRRLIYAMLPVAPRLRSVLAKTL